MRFFRIMRPATVLLNCGIVTGCIGTAVTTYVHKDIDPVEIQAPRPVAEPMAAPALRTPPTESATPSNIELRPLIRSPEKVTQKDDIDQQLFNVSMIFTIPIRANIDDDINAEFIIDPKRTEEEIKSLAQDITGQVITDKIDVSRVVTATIVAPNFKVSPKPESEQALSTTQPTKFSWVLTPTKEGPQIVQLRVIAHITIEGERVERELQTFKRDLTVEVTSKQKLSNFVGDHIEWILGGIASMIVPLFLWIKSRKK